MVALHAGSKVISGIVNAAIPDGSGGWFLGGAFRTVGTRYRANVVRLGAKHLIDKGTIVLVSGSPARKCKPGQVALSSVGAAVEALVRAVAPEIAPRRINVVSPGSIDTPMMAVQGEQRRALYEKITAGHVIPRAGTADEVAKGILFVIENDFVTGTTVDVDGGWLVS